MESPLRIVGEVKKDSSPKSTPVVSGVVDTAEVSNSCTLNWYPTWLCVRNGALSIHKDTVPADQPVNCFPLAGAGVTRAYVEDWPLAFKISRNDIGLLLRFESPDEFNRWAKSISMEVLRFTKLEEVKSLEIMGESDRSAAVKQYMKHQENRENSTKESEKEKVYIDSDKTKDEIDVFGYESCEFESFSFEELEMDRKIYFDSPKTKLVDYCKKLPTIVEKADMVNELKEVFSPDSRLLTPRFAPVPPAFQQELLKRISPEPTNAGPSNPDVHVIQQEYHVHYDENGENRVKAWTGPYILQREEKEVLENINNVFLTRRKFAREEWILEAIKRVVAEHEEKIWEIQERLARIDEEKFDGENKGSSIAESYDSLGRRLKDEEAYLQEAQAAARVQEKLVQDLTIRFEVALSKGLHEVDV